VDIHRHSSLQRRWLLNTHGLAESSHGTLAVFVNPVASSCSPNLSIDQIPSSLTTKRASYMLISQASGIINTNLHKHQIVLSIVKNDIHHDIETSQSLSVSPSDFILNRGVQTRGYPTETFYNVQYRIKSTQLCPFHQRISGRLPFNGVRAFNAVLDSEDLSLDKIKNLPWPRHEAEYLFHPHSS
jgi:hypothetical protein